MRQFSATTVAGVVLVVLAGCGERIQTTSVGPAKKLDAKSWTVGESPYVAPGWTPGDQASWDAQIRDRAQAQNDYARR